MTCNCKADAVSAVDFMGRVRKQSEIDWKLPEDQRQVLGTGVVRDAVDGVETVLTNFAQCPYCGEAEIKRLRDALDRIIEIITGSDGGVRASAADVVNFCNSVLTNT